MFDAAVEPKTFWLAPNARHNNLAEAGAFDTVHRFIGGHMID